MIEEPNLIKGDSYSDERGILRFVNDFHFNDVKRFYFIKHIDSSIVRAWQGHLLEKKYFYPICGSFAIVWVKIDDFENPSINLIPDYHILSANNSEIISVPKGYANGLKALEPNSEIMILSNMKLEDSIHENRRYPSEWWFDWNILNPK